MTSEVTYLGKLRTKSVHSASGSDFLTDAPVDNQGKGEAFSPTDTVATALASCMFTIIGIKARDHGLAVEGATAEVTKTMASEPRRIAAIELILKFPKSYSDKERKMLERAAQTCPVRYSLHPDINLDIRFEYPSH